MNIKKYLKLSNSKLAELENRYNFLPDIQDVENLSLSADKQCLKETVRIAKLHNQNKQTQIAEKRLSEKRKKAIFSLFVRPE